MLSSMTECQKRGKHHCSTFNSHGTANHNFLFLKDNERFHKSEGKAQNPKEKQNVISRAFTSSSLAVVLNFAPRPLCKEMLIEDGNGSENKYP